jgi:hypothetical protein
MLVELELLLVGFSNVNSIGLLIDHDLESSALIGECA